MSWKQRQKVMEYLAKLSNKHDIGSTEILDCITECTRTGDANCGDLTITCREKNDDTAILLFKLKDEALAQFPVPISILSGIMRRRNESLLNHYRSQVSNRKSI